ncbi:hypothetical protein ACNAW0_20520 [Micromonospora sp. SL1-18]|uniref:hypothetical protein n=1 Tax=Micromonospora sp. SL1-18 TaxID=3399128 RepID=UPI003A4D366C
MLESGQADVAVELLKAIRIPSGLLQLRMLLAVARRDGVTAAREVLAADLSDRRYKASAWDPAAHQAAQAALATTDGDGDGDAQSVLDFHWAAAAVRRLADVVAEWSGPERWISRLREVPLLGGGGFEAKLDAERHTVDWSLLLEEHQRSAFPQEVVKYLEKLPGYPLRQRSGGSWADNGDDHWRDLGAALAAGETTLDNIVATAQPAREVLWVAALGYPDRAAEQPGWWQRPDNPLPWLCADLLGAELDAWQVAVTLLDDFPGTLPELLGTAAAVSAPTPAGAG